MIFFLKSIKYVLKWKYRCRGVNMERTLSLVLDDRGYRSLTLMKDEGYEIDKFTAHNFEDHEQIRNYFKNEIKKYLKENAKYVDLVRASTGREFRGRIVILEAHEYQGRLEFDDKRVLYKKHLVAFNEMVKDKNTMKKFLQLERIGVNQYGLRGLVSPFLVREIRFADFKVVSQVNLIKKELKRNKRDFFDILRMMTKAYESERKNRPLPTIDAIYKESKKKDMEELIEVTKKEPKEFYNIDGVDYRIDDIPFDLDDLRRMDTEYRPDGLGYKDEKTIR